MAKKNLKPKSPHEESVSKYLSNFYGKEKKFANQLGPTLARLKDDYPLSQILGVAKALDKHPVAYSYFYGVPLPPSYVELRQGQYTYQTDLEKELGWYAISIIRFAPQLNLFVQYRDDFEKALLTGDYESATVVLDKIDSEICFSFWGMQQRFLIAELSGGLKKNKEFLSVINKECDDAFVTTFAYFFSSRSENKMSVQRYNNFFNNFFESIGGGIKSYFQYIVNRFSFDDYQTLNETLSYHSLSSVIDRYVTFINTAQLLIRNEAMVGIVLNTTKRINKVVDDRLINGLLLFDHDRTIKEVSSKLVDAMMIFDLYSTGSYKEAIDQARIFILNCPSELSIYEIYIKSHLFLKKEFVGITQENSLVNEILDNMHNIFEKNGNTTQSLANILKTSVTLQDSSLGNQLAAFVSRSTLELKFSEWKIVEILNAQVLNPVLVKRFVNHSQASDYLQKILKYFPLSQTVALFEQYLNQSLIPESTSLLDQIPGNRLLFYRAESIKDNGGFEQAIFLYNQLLSAKDLNIVLYEDALVNLLECYLKIGEYENYLKIFVQHHFYNANLLIRVETKTIIKQLQNAKFRNVEPSILLPVFFYITKQDSHNINIALRVFLKSLGLTRSADLKSKLDSADYGLLKFLLYNICTTEILKYSTYFEGTNDILLERVEVLQILVSIDKNKSSLYDDEISKITQNLAVSDAIRQIDESKIYVDEASLVNSEFSDIKNNFNRYIEISSLISDQRSSFIDISFNRKILLKISNKNAVAEDLGRSQVSKNVKFELFKEIFFEIRDAFLFNNKYGLDVYLSTRIRHGTLLGQFRNEFQTHHLITPKDKTSERYFRNEYWEKKTNGLDEEIRDDIQKLLADFSAKIDSTANDLKERAIQIKTEGRNVSGLFDYKIPNDNLLVYYDKVFKTIDQYNDFVYLAFQLFWRLTDINLEYIREYIAVGVKDQLLQYLSDLEMNLRGIVNDEKEIQELINNIRNCRTQLHLKLDTIANWFHIRRVTIPDFYISKVINSSLEITNKISQNSKIISPEVKFNDQTLFQGKYFIHLFDLLRIFLENIVNYSELDSSELKVTIAALETDGVLHFLIINNLSPNVDRVLLEEKFEKKREELRTANWDMNKIRTEKDTGFYKAKKNLTSDLQDETNYFDFRLNESEVEVNIYINISKLSK